MFSVNNVFYWPSATDDQEDPIYHRIIKIDSENDHIFTIDIESKSAQPVCHNYSDLIQELENFALIIAASDPYAWVNEPITNPKEIEFCERAWERIEILIQLHSFDLMFRVSRGRIIRKYVELFGGDKSTIRRNLRRFWQRGMTVYALRSDYDRCGGKGQTRITKENEESFTKKLGRPSVDAHAGTNMTPTMQAKIFAAFEQYKYRKRVSYAKAYRAMLKFAFFDGVTTRFGETVTKLVHPNQRPTYQQFYYWCKKREKEKKLVVPEKMSDREFRIKHAGREGQSSAAVDSPFARYQIDATLADIHLVHPINRAWIIGRPVIYLVTDVYSHMITGVHVTMFNPSWSAVRFALHNAMTDKVEFCKGFGIDISDEDWPCKYVPGEFYADRGEMESKAAEEMISGLRVRIINTPAYSPDFKGLVESYFNVINILLLDNLKKYDPKKELPRTGPDYRLDSYLTLMEFYYLLIHLIIHYNNFHQLSRNNTKEKAMISDLVPPYRLDIWNWGFENKRGDGKTLSSDAIKRALLPTGTMSVNGNGLFFGGLQYKSEKADREKWTSYARNNGTMKKRVRFDPYSVNTIYLVDDNPRATPEICTLHDNSQAFADLSFDEYAKCRRILKKVEYLTKDRDLEHRINREEIAERKLQNARDLTNAIREGLVNPNTLLKLIKDSKMSAQSIERAENLWIDSPSNVAKPLSVEQSLNNSSYDPDIFLLPIAMDDFED